MNPDHFLANIETITTELLASLATNLKAYCSGPFELADATIAVEHADAALAMAKAVGLLGETSALEVTRLTEWLREMIRPIIDGGHRA